MLELINLQLKQNSLKMRTLIIISIEPIQLLVWQECMEYNFIAAQTSTPKGQSIYV